MRIGNRRQIGTLYDDCWQRIYSTTLTEATNSITISGLDGNTDEEYKLIVRGRYNTDAVIFILNLNNDTGENYGQQNIQAINTALTAKRSSSETYIVLGVGEALNDISFSDTLIYAKSGKIRTSISTWACNVAGTTIGRLRIQAQSWNNTADNITSMVISTIGTNGMIAGTVIELYKKRKKI